MYAAYCFLNFKCYNVCAKLKDIRAANCARIIVFDKFNLCQYYYTYFFFKYNSVYLFVLFVNCSS